jgi:hypothetical protein
MTYGLRSSGSNFHVFIPLDFHRFTIKSLVQYPHTAKLILSLFVVSTAFLTGYLINAKGKEKGGAVGLRY